MTQKPTQRRSSSGQFTWLWMIVSVLVVGGFMYWLGVAGEPSAPPVMASDEVDDLEVAGVPTVTLDALVDGLTSYAGMDVRLEGIEVASRLGDRAFWTMTSKDVPFLVRMSPALATDSFAVAGGERVTLIGRPVLMSDSVLDAWEQDGSLATENQRLEAEFATGFVEATQAVKRPAPAGTPSSQPTPADTTSQAQP